MYFRAHTDTCTQAQTPHLTDSLPRLERILANISFCSHVYYNLMSTEIFVSFSGVRFGCVSSCLCQAVVHHGLRCICVFTSCFNVCVCECCAVVGVQPSDDLIGSRHSLVGELDPLFLSFVHTSLSHSAVSCIMKYNLLLSDTGNSKAVLC